MGSWRRLLLVRRSACRCSRICPISLAIFFPTRRLTSLRVTFGRAIDVKCEYVDQMRIVDCNAGLVVDRSVSESICNIATSFGTR